MPPRLPITDAERQSRRLEQTATRQATHRARQTARAEEMRAALRSLLCWRACVNANPAAFMHDLDHEGLACALFNGPVWDKAVSVVGGPRPGSPTKP